MLGDVVVSIMAFTLVAGIFARQNYVSTHNIWITSHSGNTKRQLPLYQALRVIRKKQWRFTNVTPTKPSIPVSRKSALKILLFGGNNSRQKAINDD